MKKYWVIIGLVAVIFCFSGCEKSEDKNSESVEVSTTKTKDKSSETDKEQKPEQKTEIQETKEQPEKSEENKSVEPEPWTPIPIDQAPADYNCEFCLGCGKTNSEVTVTKWGYCYSCFDKFRPFGSCAVCGVALDGSDTAHYDGTRCISCASRCDYCGGELDEATFASTGQYVDSLCYARYIVGCLNCGAKNETVNPSTGLCYDCMNAFNAYDICPICGSQYQNNDGYGMCYNCYNSQFH